MHGGVGERGSSDYRYFGQEITALENFSNQCLNVWTFSENLVLVWVSMRLGLWYAQVISIINGLHTYKCYVEIFCPRGSTLRGKAAKPH